MSKREWVQDSASIKEKMRRQDSSYCWRKATVKSVASTRKGVDISIVGFSSGFDCALSPSNPRKHAYLPRPAFSPKENIEALGNCHSHASVQASHRPSVSLCYAQGGVLLP
jgi:hypothetical protein